MSAPGAPTNLRATGVTVDSITLAWSAPGDADVSGYQILRRRPLQGEKKLQVHVADTGSTSTTWTDTGLDAKEMYVYRVRALSSDGSSSPLSNFTNVETAWSDPGSNVISSLRVVLIEKDTIGIAWNPVRNPNVQGYQILRRRPQQGETQLLVHVSDTGSASTTWTETGLDPEETYVYRVKAVGTGGEITPASNFAKAKTLAEETGD